MQQLLTMEQVKERFQVKDNRTIKNFLKQGLRFIKIGKEYRFDTKDVEDFMEQQKNIAQELIEIKPIKVKKKFKTIDIDFEKRKINLTQMKVI